MWVGSSGGGRNPASTSAASTSMDEAEATRAAGVGYGR